MEIINRSIDFIQYKFNFNRCNYLRLLRGINDISLKYEFYKLGNYPTGVDLTIAIRRIGIDIRFGIAKINEKITCIILIDLGFTDFAHVDGRYLVHTMEKYTISSDLADLADLADLPNLPNQIFHIEHCYRVYPRLPNGWDEMPNFASCRFD